MYPEHICDEGDCTSYGVITFEFWADDYPRELYGKHFCVRHAVSHLTKRAPDVAYECPKCGDTLEKDGWCNQHGLPAQPRR